MSEAAATHRDLASVERRLDGRISGHEDVCAERMKRIDDRMQSSDQAREAMRVEMKNGFSGVYTRLWWAAAAIMAIQTGALGYLLATNGLPGVK